MRFILLAVLLAGCASAAAQTPASIDLWRMHTEHLAADRALANTCLREARQSCDDVIQDACRAGIDEDARTGASERVCDWRAIAAWEDEMNASLAHLRATMRGRDLENLEASQRAWNASMLANVGLVMDMYEGGTLAGQTGAYVRARATAQRARYLSDIPGMLE